MFLLWLFARHEAELSYYIIFFVVGGVTILAFIGGLFSPWIGIAIYLLGLPYAIGRFCYVSLAKSILVTFLFILTQIGISFTFDSLLSSPSQQITEEAEQGAAANP
jgi:hypothetical protein